MARPTRELGFTLVELGIVVAIVCILSAVVISGRGFMNAARHRSTVQLFEGVRHGARTWAERNCNATAFKCTDDGGVFLEALPGAVAHAASPWNDSLHPTVTSVSDSLIGCELDSCIRICLPWSDCSDGNAEAIVDALREVSGVRDAGCVALPTSACGVPWTNNDFGIAATAR